MVERIAKRREEDRQRGEEYKQAMARWFREEYPKQQEEKPIKNPMGLKPNQTFESFEQVEGTEEAYKAMKALATGEGADFMFLLL